MLNKIAVLATPCLLLASIQAQSFNINFDTASVSTLPTSYGGKAGQTGKWNMIDLTSTSPQSIKLLSGSTAGCLTIKPSIALPTMTWPDTKTCGPIEKLLDSFTQIPATGADVEISGLRPGSYAVWVYARHPMSCWYSCTVARWTKISVNGDTTPENGVITFVIGWNTLTTNSDDFGYDARVEILFFHQHLELFRVVLR